jgi:hypothetical protein
MGQSNYYTYYVKDKTNNILIMLKIMNPTLLYGQFLIYTLMTFYFKFYNSPKQQLERDGRTCLNCIFWEMDCSILEFSCDR